VDKCEFEHTTIEYLGPIISEGCVEVDPVKVARVAKWPVPKNKKEVQQFPGFTNSTEGSFRTSCIMPTPCLI
jgi:hypothetical protein